MQYQLPKLKFTPDALSGFISPETIQYHYEHHHKGYIQKLNLLLKDSPLKTESLEQILLKASGSLFNNAAQAWNHTFYWEGLSKNISQRPLDAGLFKQIEAEFGSFSTFKESYIEAGIRLFGSGWVWLVKNEVGNLKIITTPNAQNPLTQKLVPLLCCDVWEHAYYIDYRNERKSYLKRYFERINWDFVRANLEKDIPRMGELMIQHEKNEDRIQRRDKDATLSL